MVDYGVAQPPFSALLHERRGIPVVAVGGEIDLATVGLLRETIEEAVAQTSDPPRVVVDLRGVSFMEATGLGVLLRQRSALGELGGDLWLVVSREGAAARLLGLTTGLDEVFRIHPDCDSAVEEIERGA